METNTVDQEELDSLRSEVSRLLGENAELVENAARYQYIRSNYEWRREGGDLGNPDSTGLIVVKVPYLADLSCAAMVDYALDKLRHKANHQKEQANDAD